MVHSQHISCRWKIGCGEYVAEEKSEQLRIYMTTVGEFFVTYPCRCGQDPDEELGGHVVQCATSHQDLDAALSELAT